MKITTSILLLFVATSLYTYGDDSNVKIKITQDIPKINVDVLGKAVEIKRIQDTKHKLKNSYSKTSRPCPPFCIQPFEPIKGIKTIGEVELLKFLKNEVSNNSGILIDARLSKWFHQGTIPGAINIPFPILNPNSSNSYIDNILPLLGAIKDKNGWNFKDAQKIVVFDNGPWSQQGTRAMQHLVSLGYPKDKMQYYRGGMQYWQILGLTVLKDK